MTAELAVAMAALAISLGSFVVNYLTSRDAERHGRMPVLIPRNVERDVLAVRNVGRGPAINVALATGPAVLAHQDALKADLSPHKDDWHSFLHLGPLDGDSEVMVEYSLDGNAPIGLHYTDALGVPYTVLSSGSGTKMVDGSHIAVPPFNKLEWARYVELGDGSGPETREGSPRRDRRAYPTEAPLDAGLYGGILAPGLLGESSLGPEQMCRWCPRRGTSGNGSDNVGEHDRTDTNNHDPEHRNRRHGHGINVAGEQRPPARIAREGDGIRVT